MAIQRRQSFDSLYQDISDFDLVVCPEPSLADALCRRLDRPHLGEFASTPRRLASRRIEPREDRTAFHTVVAETDLDWTAASYAVGNVLQCWEYDGTPNSVLNYPRYDDPAHQAVVDLLQSHDTTQRALTEDSIDSIEHPDGVAVIAPELMSPLERSILPDDYTVIDPFTDEYQELAPFRVFESSAAIVDALMHTITPENAEDVAVVLDSGGSYASLVESALDAADIPFYGGTGFMDQNHHRAFLQLLRLLHAGSDVRVEDARPLFAALDVDLPVTHNAKRLDDVESPALEWLHNLRHPPSDPTVADLVDAVDTRTYANMDDLRKELGALGVLNEPATSDIADRLLFYFQRYDVPVERDNEGVLLADATSAAYVDRPLVFYLGLDESWTHSSPRRPWIDGDKVYDRSIQEFQILLQNGQEQYYLVQDTEAGEPVSPTIYLEDLLDEEFEGFTDLYHVNHTRANLETGDGFEHEGRGIAAKEVEAISQSRLNSYVNSPRDYFFSQLLDSPDQDYFEEGTWFHDFAEVYATHPNKVDNTDIDTVVDSMADAVAPFIDDSTGDLRRTTYRLGLEQIMRYLDAHPPQETDGEPGWKPYDGNRVADLLGVEADGPHTEVWFRDTERGIKGSIDLVHSARELVDYKKGSHKKPRKKVENAALDPPGDTPNYQAIMYLARQRAEQPDTPLAFTFLHFLETLDERVTNEGDDLEDCLSTVEYYPETFHEHLQRSSVYQYLRDEHYNDCNDTFDAITEEDYRELVAAEDPPDTTDSDEMQESPFGQQFIEGIIARVDEQTNEEESVDAEKGAQQALRHFASVNSETFFAPDLDNFEEFVSDCLDELNNRRRGRERFPVADLKDEPNERRLNHRDLLLGEDR